MPENNFLFEFDEAFDVIFCITVFEHLNQPLEIIKCFHHYLKKNGLLFFDYIKGAGDGLDTHHGVREREEVLSFIDSKFKVVFGQVDKEKSMGLTVVRKL